MGTEQWLVKFALFMSLERFKTINKSVSTYGVSVQNFLMSCFVNATQNYHYAYSTAFSHLCQVRTNLWDWKRPLCVWFCWEDLKRFLSARVGNKKKKKMIFLLTEEIVFLYMIPVYYTIYDITGKTMRFAVRSNSVCSLSVSYWLSNVEQII